MKNPNIKIVLCTCPNLDLARHIGTYAIENQLAACVNLIPKVESIYSWNNEINRDLEVLTLFKTTEELLDKLESAILELHSYDLPEIIVLPVEGGSKSYLEWIADSNKISDYPRG